MCKFANCLFVTTTVSICANCLHTYHLQNFLPRNPTCGSFQRLDTPRIKINIRTAGVRICPQLVHNHSNFLVLLGQTLFLRRAIFASSINASYFRSVTLQAITPWCKSRIKISNFLLGKTLRIRVIYSDYFHKITHSP